MACRITALSQSALSFRGFASFRPLLPVAPQRPELHARATQDPQLEISWDTPASISSRMGRDRSVLRGKNPALGSNVNVENGQSPELEHAHAAKGEKLLMLFDL
jgi:hypothetical protein